MSNRRNCPRSARNLLALLIVVLLALASSACSGDRDDGGDSTDEESADALVNCSANPSRIYFEVRETYDGKPTPIYGDEGLGKQIGTLGAKNRVFLDLESVVTGSIRSTIAGSMHVREESNSGFGWTGWVRIDALKLAAPEGGECKSGVAFASAASPAMRMASTEYGLPASLARNAVACGLGLGAGVGQGVVSLVEGLAALIQVVPTVIYESSAILGDMVLASIGQEEALARLQNKALKGKERIEAAAALVGHALPALHEYLRGQYVYYDALPPDEQSGMLCRIVGRVAFEAVVFLATPGGIVKGGAVVKAAIETAHADAVLGAKLAGRVAEGSVIVDLKTTQQTKAAVWQKYMSENRWKAALAEEQRIQAAWMAEHQAKYAALLDSKTIEDRLKRIAELADVSNPAHRLRITGGGNCAFASLTTLTMLATGHPQCALPQFSAEHFNAGFDAELLRIGGKTATTPGYRVDAASMLKAAEALEENQMAHLGSYSGRGAHGTLVVRMGGKLWHVNNQGWEAFESLEAWTRRWATMDSAVYYVLWTTEQRIPFRSALN